MPKPPPQKSLIVVPARARSREVASFFAQLDDQSRRMFADLQGCTAAELAWQPRRGANTIGMLLAHCAIVEAIWLLIATGSKSTPEAVGCTDPGLTIPSTLTVELPSVARDATACWAVS